MKMKYINCILLVFCTLVAYLMYLELTLSETPTRNGPEAVSHKILQNEYKSAINIVNSFSNIEIISYNTEDLVRTVQKPASVDGFIFMGTYSGTIEGGGPEVQRYGIRHNVHIVCKDTNENYYITFEEYSSDSYCPENYDSTSLIIKKENVVVFRTPRTPSTFANYNSYRRAHYEWEVKEGKVNAERHIFQKIIEKGQK